MSGTTGRVEGLDPDHPLFSIIIPARNEAADIAATLDACLAMDWDPKEIIVVDDSVDETPLIVAGYADRGVQLIHRELNRNGCCGARTLGMQRAQGDIVVVLNADDRPRPDFLQRLYPHYQSGADYVVVRSTVLNQDVLWGKFAAAAGALAESTTADPEWSEGFSCRRSAAAQVGYFPGDFPVPFCRDYLLGVALNRAGFKKVVDASISVEHVVPSTLAGYWRNQVWRGGITAPFLHYIRRLPWSTIALRECLKAGRRVASYLLVVPAAWRAVRLASYGPGGRRDFPRMLVASLVQDMALIVGGFKGLGRVRGAMRTGQR